MPDNYEGDNLYLDNALDLGLQVGGGFKVAKFLVIDVRYGLGLSNIVDKDEANGISKNKSKNRSLQLTVGFPISLGGK